MDSGTCSLSLCRLVYKLVRKELSANGTFVKVVAFFFPDIDLAFLLSFLP